MPLESELASLQLRCVDITASHHITSPSSQCYAVFLCVELGMPEAAKRKPLWEPSPKLSRRDVVRLHDAVLELPTIQIRTRADIFRIRTLEMDWDIAVMVYEPTAAEKIPAGPDGKKAGIFSLHGGMGDYSFHWRGRAHMGAYGTGSTGRDRSGGWQTLA